MATVNIAEAFNDAESIVRPLAEAGNANKRFINLCYAKDHLFAGIKPLLTDETPDVVLRAWIAFNEQCEALIQLESDCYGKTATGRSETSEAE